MSAVITDPSTCLLVRCHDKPFKYGYCRTDYQELIDLGWLVAFGNAETRHHKCDGCMKCRCPRGDNGRFVKK